MGTIANAKVTHYYNCYNGDFIGCLQLREIRLRKIKISEDYLKNRLHEANKSCIKIRQ